MPAYIAHCLETLQQRSGVPVVIGNDQIVESIIPDSVLNPKWRTLPKLAQQVDCLRIAFIALYGGGWVDADTLWLHPFADFMEQVEDFDLLYTRWNDGRILNGYIFARKDSPIIRQWLGEINKQLLLYDGTQRLVWTQFGERIITPLFQKMKSISKTASFVREMLIPVNFDRHGSIFFEKRRLSEFMKGKDVRAVALNHSWAVDWDKSGLIVQSLEEVCRRDDLIGDIFSLSCSIEQRVDNAERFNTNTAV